MESWMRKPQGAFRAAIFRFLQTNGDVGGCSLAKHEAASTQRRKGAGFQPSSLVLRVL